MTNSHHDAGIIVTLLNRIRILRLPRALNLRRKVSHGHPLSELDIDFLREIFRDAQTQSARWTDHPELRDVGGRFVHILHEITTIALENEQRA